MLTQEQVTQFHEQGFLNIGKVYSGEECDRLNDVMHKVMREETEKKPVNLGGWGADNARVLISQAQTPLHSRRAAPGPGRGPFPQDDCADDAALIVTLPVTSAARASSAAARSKCLRGQRSVRSLPAMIGPWPTAVSPTPAFRASSMPLNS